MQIRACRFPEAVIVGSLRLLMAAVAKNIITCQSNEYDDRGLARSPPVDECRGGIIGRPGEPAHPNFPPPFSSPLKFRRRPARSLQSYIVLLVPLGASVVPFTSLSACELAVLGWPQIFAFYRRYSVLGGRFGATQGTNDPGASLGFKCMVGRLVHPLWAATQTPLTRKSPVRLTARQKHQMALGERDTDTIE